METYALFTPVIIPARRLTRLLLFAVPPLVGLLVLVLGRDLGLPPMYGRLGFDLLPTAGWLSGNPALLPWMVQAQAPADGASAARKPQAHGSAPRPGASSATPAAALEQRESPARPAQSATENTAGSGVGPGSARTGAAGAPAAWRSR